MGARSTCIVALTLVLSAAAVEAEAAPPASESTATLLTIDSPILELLFDPITRPVVAKHLPNLSDRLLNDANAAELLGASSPRELAVDPHVRNGIPDSVLEALQADLDSAQKAKRSH